MGFTNELLDTSEEVSIHMRKKLVDPNKLCMGCMAELERPGFPCPRCGFDARRYQKPKNSLPLYEIVNGKYLIGRVIGIGGFGITYIAWDFYQGKRVCVKEYFPRRIAVRDFHGSTYSEQISISINCSSQTYSQEPERAQTAYMKGLEAYIKEAENLSRYYMMENIVSIRDFFYGNNTAYIVMEYIDGINMKEYTKRRGGRLMPEEVFVLLKDVLKALDTIHKNNIIHRDISPDNIMLNRAMKAVLIDFGAARDYGNTKNASILLKHGYAPVEQYKSDGKQGPWTDVYSMCASMYCLMTGARLPSSTEREKHDTVQRLSAIGIPVSEQQDQAIWRGLRIEPGQRYQSMAALYRDLYGE